MVKVLSCLASSRPRTAESSSSLLPINDEGYREGCPFCNTTSLDVIHQTDELIVFRDRWPRGAEHLLVIPRQHIVSTVNELTGTHLPLLRSMHKLARGLRPEPGTKMGYHIPPFSSVHHLHLHIITPPFTLLGRLQYPVRYNKDGGKGRTWFVTPDQVERILERGGKIGLGSS